MNLNKKMNKKEFSLLLVGLLLGLLIALGVKFAWFEAFNTKPDQKEVVGEQFSSSSLRVRDEASFKVVPGRIKDLEFYNDKVLVVVSIDLNNIFVDPPKKRVERGFWLREDDIVRAKKIIDGKNKEKRIAISDVPLTEDSGPPVLLYRGGGTERIRQKDLAQNKIFEVDELLVNIADFQPTQPSF